MNAESSLLLGNAGKSDGGGNLELDAAKGIAS